MGLFDRNKDKTKAEEKQSLVANLSMFQIALREGMGFAYACEVSNNDPKEVTEIMTANEDFHKECITLVRGANMDRLLAASEHTKKQEWEKADKAREDAKRISKLFLWESKGKIAEVKEDEVFDAYCELHGDFSQMAVCFGATRKEMKEYMESRQELQNMVKIIQKQWNNGLDSQGKKK